MSIDEDWEWNMEIFAEAFGTTIQVDRENALWFDVGGSNSIFCLVSDNLISKSVNRYIIFCNKSRDNDNIVMCCKQEEL